MVLNLVSFTAPCMDSITLQTLKTKGSKSIPDEGVVYLIVNSKVKSVLVPPAQYDMLQSALEELEDIRYIEAHKNEKTVPFEKAFPAR